MPLITLDYEAQASAACKRGGPGVYNQALTAGVMRDALGPSTSSSVRLRKTRATRNIAV